MLLFIAEWEAVARIWVRGQCVCDVSWSQWHFTMQLHRQTQSVQNDEESINYFSMGKNSPANRLKCMYEGRPCYGCVQTQQRCTTLNHQQQIKYDRRVVSTLYDQLKNSWLHRFFFLSSFFFCFIETFTDLCDVMLCSVRIGHYCGSCRFLCDDESLSPQLLRRNNFHNLSNELWPCLLQYFMYKCLITFPSIVALHSYMRLRLVIFIQNFKN